MDACIPHEVIGQQAKHINRSISSRLASNVLVPQLRQKAWDFIDHLLPVAPFGRGRCQAL